MIVALFFMRLVALASVFVGVWQGSGSPWYAGAASCAAWLLMPAYGGGK